MRCEPDNPAFHAPHVSYSPDLADPVETRRVIKIVAEGGLTKREYFAVHILAGLLANQDYQGAAARDESARSAVIRADYLIKALNEERT